MQSLAYNFEQQRQLMEVQLQVQAMRAEQLRIAKAANPSISLMSRVRTVVGGKLIATGERMRQNMEAASEAAAAHSKAAQRA